MALFTSDSGDLKYGFLVSVTIETGTGGIMGFNRVIVVVFFLVLIPLSGCGGGLSGDDTETDDTGTDEEPVTSGGAEDVTQAAVQTTLAAVSGVSSASLSEVPPALKAARALMPNPKKAITVTDALSDCESFSSIPTLSGASITISGADLGTGGSGSCTVTLDTFTLGDLDRAEAVLSCVNFTGGEATAFVTIDGDIGMSFSSSFTADVEGGGVTIYSPGLLMGFIENSSTRICEIIMDINETVVITTSDDSITATSSTTGCISVCGESFNVDGTETQTVSLEN